LSEETTIGNYQIDERIARGGMGVVYRGHHTQLPRDVAIKFISARDHDDLRRQRSRFEKEAYIQSQLDHPGIVKVYDYIVTEQTYYIVMELVEGRSLAQLCASDECPLPVDRALDMLEQILAAISHAHTFVYLDQSGLTHRGLIHRDLKPANILISTDDKVKITDFGIVKLVGTESTDTLSGGYGTPEYVSPEQAEGAQVDQRSDIYSIGVILYEMLTGDPPFCCKDDSLSQADILRMHLGSAPRPPSEINDEIKPELEAIILRALEKRPEDRFPTALAFLREVRRLRGLDTGDLKEKGEPSKLPRQKGKTQPAPFQDTTRQRYVTQPMTSTTCTSCGAEVDSDDARCTECGQELGATISTAQLTQKDASAEKRMRSQLIWFAAALTAFALIAMAIYFAQRHGASNQQNSNASGEVNSAATAPSGSVAEIRPSRVLVDSSYEGYTAAPLTDGEIDVRKIAAMRYNKGNWASAETPEAHWIELDFDSPVRLAAVYLYWGYDRSRFMPSRKVELQTTDEHGGWKMLSELAPGDDYDRTAFEFAPATVSKLRIFQPAQEGPTSRPFIMWVREVKAYGLK